MAMLGPLTMPPSLEPALAPKPASAWAIAYQRKLEARHARTKARNTLNKRASRVRQRTAAELEEAEMLAILGDLDMPPPPCLEPHIEEAAAEALERWLAIDGPRQRQHRRRAPEYLASYFSLLQMRLELGGIDPEPAEFAERLTQETGETFDRKTGRNRLNLLLRLEGEGGPWAR